MDGGGTLGHGWWRFFFSDHSSEPTKSHNLPRDLLYIVVTEGNRTTSTYVEGLLFFVLF